jgi:hypothetical protein
MPMEPIKDILPEAAQNSEQALLELIPPKSGDLSDAISNKPIVERNLEELKEALRYVMVKIGLRSQNWPSEEEKGTLISHIIANYGGHTPEEIMLAFDMAILRKLDLDEREIPCYENFSCLYFSTIMNAYRLWAKQEYKYIPTLPDPPKTEQKEDVSDKAMKDWLAETSAKVKSGQCTVEFIPLMLYDWMDKRKEIKTSSAEKKKYLVKATEFRFEQLLCECTNKPSVDNRKLFESFSTMMEAGCFTGKEIDGLKGLAKKMILYDLIKSNEYVDRPMPEVQEGLGDVPGPTGVDDGSGDSNGG